MFQCLCSECAKTLRLQSNKCPICRQPIEELMEIKIDNDGQWEIIWLMISFWECRIQLHFSFCAVPLYTCMLSYFPLLLCSICLMYISGSLLSCMWARSCTYLCEGIWSYNILKNVGEFRSTFSLSKHLFNFNVLIIYFPLMWKCGLFPFSFVLLLTNLTSSSPKEYLFTKSLKIFAL